MTVQIVLPGIGTLRLTEEQYAAALQPIAPQPAVAAAPEQELVDGPALARLSGLPVSLLMEMGRQGKLPSTKVGKYRRFDAAACMAILRRGDAPLSASQSGACKSLDGKGKSGPATGPLPRFSRRNSNAVEVK